MSGQPVAVEVAGLVHLSHALTDPRLDHAARTAGVVDEREAGLRPRGDAAVEVLGVIALLLQSADGRRAARTAAAHRDDTTVLRHLAQPRAELAERDVLRALDVAGLPLVVLTDVEQMMVGPLLREVLRRHRSILTQNGAIEPPYPTDIVPLIPEFLNRRRVKFTYPLRVVDELGIDGAALRFVVNGVALHSDEGARLVDIFNPYQTVFDQWHASAAMARGAGLVDEVGGKWHATAKGRELFARVRKEADAYLATLTPIPTKEIAHLAGLFARALAAIDASGVPKDHIPRSARFRGDGTIAMVALENALFGLWQARDDCHMSSWRAAAFDGPTFDALTRIWRKEASDETGLAAKLAQQRPEDVRGELARLRRDGLVRSEVLETTERGAQERQESEDETDRKFFAPWPADVGAQATWIHERLAALNKAIAPAS